MCDDAQSSPPIPRDDRLDLSASGKSRSDPARGRMRAGARSRGRHSIDLGRDLKKHMAAQTIDENVRGLLIACAQSYLLTMLCGVCKLATCVKVQNCAHEDSHAEECT